MTLMCGPFQEKKNKTLRNKTKQKNTFLKGLTLASTVSNISIIATISNKF